MFYSKKEIHNETLIYESPGQSLWAGSKPIWNEQFKDIRHILNRGESMQIAYTQFTLTSVLTTIILSLARCQRYRSISVWVMGYGYDFGL